MGVPKGFAKNYFSLSAICAYSSASVLHSLCTSLTHSSRNISFEVNEEEQDPLEELDILIQESSLDETSSLAHCNCYFKQRLYTLKQYFKFHPLTFFIYHKTHSGIAPPLRPYHSH